MNKNMGSGDKRHELLPGICTVQDLHYEEDRHGVVSWGTLEEMVRNNGRAEDDRDRMVRDLTIVLKENME
jgi:hypothetical protein